MTNWKVIAIIFIILFTLETTIFVWGWYLIAEEDRMMKECYYEICGDYADAEIFGDVCSCYEYDLIGNLQTAKTVYMK